MNNDHNLVRMAYLSTYLADKLQGVDTTRWEDLEKVIAKALEDLVSIDGMALEDGDFLQVTGRCFAVLQNVLVR